MRRQGQSRGFRHGASFLQQQIRRAAETRGFSQARLLTQWDEIAGPEIAAIARPVKVGYPPRGGLGATLTLLTTGAQAPLLEMQKEMLRERVNAVYGYNAIARISITQTAPTGFAEGQAAFRGEPRRKPASPSPTAPESRAQAARLVRPVTDPALHDALERLAQNVLGRAAPEPNTKSER